MKAEFRNQLPAAVLPLVEEIEDAAGCEILVQQKPEMVTPQEAGFADVDGRYHPVVRYRESFGCDDGPEGIYREPYAIATHELLHHQRYFVERVPLMGWARELAVIPGCTDLMRDGQLRLFSATWMESALEHLVIEQRMPQYGFAPPNYDGHGSWWSERTLQLQSPVAQRWGYLTMWLPTRYFASRGVRARAERSLERDGLLRSAELLYTNTVQTIGKPGKLFVPEGKADQQKYAMSFLYTLFARLPQHKARFTIFLKNGRCAVNGFPLVVNCPAADGSIIDLRRPAPRG
jgi:hypothetical protein